MTEIKNENMMNQEVTEVEILDDLGPGVFSVGDDIVKTFSEDEARDALSDKSNDDVELGPILDAEANDETPVDAAVPADAGEVEREEKKADAKPETRVRPRANVKKAERAQEEVGIMSDNLLKEEANKLSPAEQEERNWRDLTMMARAGMIMYARVDGIEPVENHQTFNVILTFKGVRIVIPEEEYFMPDMTFTNAYDTLSPRDKYMVRLSTARHQLNAKVCFMIKNNNGQLGMSRTRADKVADVSGVSPWVYVCVGSRVDAMKKLQDIWFFHKNKNGARRYDIKEGDVAIAYVLSVREDGVRVECRGVESFISAFELTGIRFVTDCRNEVKPGDRIKVRVKKLHVNLDDTVYMSVSGRMYDTDSGSKNISQMTEGGWYSGVVRSYSPASQFYTVNLNNGVIAAVRHDMVQGHMTLDPGDTVSVLVIKIFDEHVMGRAVLI